jgi:4-amino-4-deoxy-L-arabinose transferase-like glycosyltransferase
MAVGKNIADLFLAVDSVFILAFVSHILGTRLLAHFRFQSHCRLERFLISQALGLAAVSYSVFFMGLLGGITKINFVFLYLILLPLIFFPDIKRISASIKERLTNYNFFSWIREKKFFFKLFFLLFAVFCVLNFFNTLAPPVERDALVYHLRLPQHYLQTGRMQPIESNFYSYFPQFAEMLFTFGLTLSNDHSASLIHFYFGLLAALAIFSFVRRVSTSESALICMLVFYSTPMVSVLSSWAYVDLALCFFTLLGVYLLIRALDELEPALFKLSAVLLGLALCVKYLAFYSIYIIPILFLTRYIKAESQQRRFLLRQAMIFFCLCSAVALPWYLRNSLLTGNPLYPFFYSIFGGANWDAERANLYNGFLKRYGMGYSVIDILLLPWRLVVYGSEGFPFDGAVGPAYFVLVPLLIWFRPKRRAIFYLLLYSLCFYAIWASQGHVARYLLPVFAILSLSLYTLFDNSPKRSISIHYAVTILCAGLVGYNLTCNLGQLKKSEPIAMITREDGRSAFLSSRLKNYKMVQYINANLSSKSRIYAVYIGNIGYYLKRDFFEEIIFTDYSFRKLLNGADSPRQIARYLNELKITHLLVDEKMAMAFLYPSLNAGQSEIYNEFYGEYLQAIRNDGTAYLYKINYEEAGI